MKFYKYKDKFLFSYYDYEFDEISKEDFEKNKNEVYFLNQLDPLFSRRSFIVSNLNLLENKLEDINLLNKTKTKVKNSFLEDKIDKNMLISINTNYPKWKDVLFYKKPEKYKINLLALGDVGSNLAIGLRLLGGDNISSLNLYDRNENRLNRWIHELNQINIPFDEDRLPPVYKTNYDDLFDCDIFVFCASKGIPEVGSNIGDVRMAQFHSNSNIIKEYAIKAREENFKGIFAVVSDPVDLLCKVAFLESNKNKNEELDFLGLAADQIIGYGLGVMNGRAVFYADEMDFREQYIDEGRVFGPHGKGLICVNSIYNYDKELSEKLTKSVLNANLVVRDFGYKPYIAPSLSSGSISIIHTMNEDWFYGSTYMGGAYIGSKCRIVNNNLEIEQVELDERIFEKIKKTNNNLVDII